MFFSEIVTLIAAKIWKIIKLEHNNWDILLKMNDLKLFNSLFL